MWISAILIHSVLSFLAFPACVPAHPCLFIILYEGTTVLIYFGTYDHTWKIEIRKGWLQIDMDGACSIFSSIKVSVLNIPCLVLTLETAVLEHLKSLCFLLLQKMCPDACCDSLIFSLPSWILISNRTVPVSCMLSATTPGPAPWLPHNGFGFCVYFCWLELEIVVPCQWIPSQP